LIQGARGIQGPDGLCYKLAVVPARGRYVSLACVEMPEVKVADVLVCTLPVGCSSQTLELDVDFVTACVPGSLQVVGCVPERPVACTADVQQSRLTLRRDAADLTLPLDVTLKIMGTRFDRDGQRFKRYTQAQALRNYIAISF